ncbi:MAG: hypothetical protein KA170_06795 [Candidatus Promineofilum sp.]|nr:hypothetical protein [Promineifilum sp.]
MRMLSSDQFERAADYLRHEARPLERALFAHAFEGGGRTAVLAALVPYQNDDGGFGRALEPDMRAPASSVVATTMAFDILRRVGATEETSGLPAALVYLIDNYDAETGRWPIISPAVEEAPHAPWWAYAESATNFRDFWANPRASVVGYLWQYRKLVPSPFVEGALRSAATALLTYAQTMEMHDLMCYVDLLATPDLPGEMRQNMIDKLRRVVARSVVMAPAEWNDYNLKPLTVVRSPQSELAAAVDPAVLDANLDYLIATQAADGTWRPNWSWDFVDADAWAAAEREWRGVLTLRNLATLQAFGRLA